MPPLGVKMLIKLIKKNEMCVAAHFYYHCEYVSHLGRRMSITNQPDLLTVTRIDLIGSNIWLETEATADSDDLCLHSKPPP